jgi:hypothetical protein
MKKIIVLVLLLSVTGFANAEMLENPSFENLDGSWATGWSGWGSGSGSGWAGYQWYSGGQSFINDGTAYDGDIYMETHAMNASYSSWWGWGWNAAWQIDRMPCSEGQEYTLSAYIRNGAGDGYVGGGPAILKLEWYDSVGTMIDNPRVFYDMDNNWNLITFSATAPSSVVEMQTVIGTEMNGVYIDWDAVSLTTGLAVNVYPLNGATNVPINAVLEWGPPPIFTPIAYDVYRSITDPNADKVKDQVVFHANQTTYDDPLDMEYDTLYYWRVNAYDPCDVIRDPGSVWTFTTWPVSPVFTTDAESTSVEAGSSAQISVETPRSNDFQWYKDGTPDTEVNDGDDGGDVSVVSDGTSSTLTISNVEQADEGYYYCVAEGTGSTESNHARLLIKRLMGHWKFDAMSLNDEVAGNHGTLADPNTNNPPPPPPTGGTWWGPGINGGAIKLQTGDFYIDIPNQEYFNFHAQGFTISAWIQTEQTAWGAIVSKANRLSPFTGWVLHHNGDTAHMTLRSPSGGNNEATFNAGLADNEWHMLVGTYDEQTGMLALYVDGEKRSEAGPFWTLTETDTSLKIGSELNSSDPTEDDVPYDGLVDDVKIYSYAQDGYEVATEYTDIAGGSVCVEPVPGDLDGDCVIGTGDLAVVALDWLECDLIPTSACN